MESSGPVSGTLFLRATFPPTTGAARLPETHNFPHDYGIFIGRMRPVTNAHLANIHHALKVSALVVVIIGSARQAPSPRTPFSEEQVENMLRGNFSASENGRLIVRGMRDLYNNALWLAGVRSLVKDVIAHHGPAVGKPRITLVGHFKDARTNDYLKRFRPWSLEQMPNIDRISATPIREDYWEDPVAALACHAHELPANVIAFLQAFAATPEYLWLVEEHKAYRKDRKPYEGMRFKPTFHTTDAVVILDDHILLIERDLRPGYRLLSLPGGFVNDDEEIADAMLRSLYDKTRIKVPKRVVASRVSATHVFSYPWRSERGRIISTAFLVELDEDELPKVSPAPDKGSLRAVWTPLDELDPRLMYEDHMRIIEVMLGFTRKG